MLSSSVGIAGFEPVIFTTSHALTGLRYSPALFVPLELRAWGKSACKKLFYGEDLPCIRAKAQKPFCPGVFEPPSTP